MSDSTDLERYIAKLPKAELHCHLAGTMQPETLLELGRKNDVDLPFDDPVGAHAFFEFEGLESFLDVLDTCVTALQTAEDFERVVVEHAAEARRQNVIYEELFTTFELHRSRGIDWDTYVTGISRGRERAREKYDLDLEFIACIDRRIEPSAGVDLVEKVSEERERAGFIGIGLDSQERGYPAHRHTAAFSRARELDLRRVAHAGEEVGPSSVWDALAALGVARIDHGVQAIADDILVEYLAREAIPLTVCPVSNVQLNYGRMEAHPIVDLADAGVLVTINSDDPPMFGADLNENYRQVAATFDLSAETVTKLARNGLQATFAAPAAESELLDRFDREAARLRDELGT